MMKLKLTICSILLLMLLSPQAVMLENAFEQEMAGAKSTGCTGAVCLNELFVNAIGQETDAVGPADWTTGEWVELYNNGGSDVDLSGWYLQDHSSRQMDISITSSPVTVVWPQNAQNLLIPAGGYTILWSLYDKYPRGRIFIQLKFSYPTSSNLVCLCKSRKLTC
ncbi:MAG: hypothetical protein CXT67_08185 [Methanobacteriota archaeon]|nr:MAG: hypothetical protein CXT67_08185 [Euryarchaeota archaeon]